MFACALCAIGYWGYDVKRYVICRHKYSLKDSILTVDDNCRVTASFCLCYLLERSQY